MTRKTFVSDTSPRKNPPQKRGLMQRYAAAPHIVWSILFIIAPLIFVAYYAFTDADGAFTLANVSSFFTEKYLLIFFRSLKLALIATAICLLLGYPIAYFISRSKPKTQKILILLLMLPMWMNFLIRTYAIMVLIQDTGIINSFLGSLGIPPIHILGTEGAVIIGMVYDYLPFMILPIYSVFAKMDLSCVDAAEDLGANKVQTFLRVTLPLSKSGIISGSIMVFMPSMTTFVISVLLGGSKTLYYGDLIEYQFLQFSDWNFGSALAIVLMIIMVLSLFLLNRGDKEGEGVYLL